MDLFDVIAGSIGIISAVFALYVYLESKKKEAVEIQKAHELSRQLDAIQSVAVAVAKQGSLAAKLSDRDEVTKKELKHLLVAQMSSIESLVSVVRQTAQSGSQWKFGVPDRYVFGEEPEKARGPVQP